MAVRTVEVEGTCQLCRDAGVSQSTTAYYVGVMLYKLKTPAKIWQVCELHAMAALDKLGDQCFGTSYWPVACDLNKRVIYSSYAASQQGLSMTAGWEAYLINNPQS